MKKKTEIVILGAGESGAGAAMLARQKGYSVFVSDSGRIRENYKNVLSNIEVEVEEGKHSEETILSADLVIKSPGIPDEAPVVLKARKKGVKVISEIEFAGYFTEGKKICITGSNGKTTTAMLTEHVLRKGGLDVCLAGNVGKSFAAALAESDHDYWVLEISSFQLDGMHDFKADTAILLNITPDHLDRYSNDFSRYVGSKFRITRNQSSADHFVFNADDRVIMRELKKSEMKSLQVPFSIEQRLSGDCAFKNENELIIKIKSKKFNMTLEELALQGKHNLYNSMAAGITARLLDIRKEIIKDSLSEFQHIEHRLEFVASIHGIEFINDSKATNVNSTWYALESTNKQVVWIAGGIDKGNDYSLIKGLVKEKVKAIVCLGVNNERILSEFSGDVENIVEIQAMSEAVKIAYHFARRNDMVLLSPACASFDLFDNYEDRGRQFKNAVNNL